MPYRSYLPEEAFIPEGYIPILEAASLLAFGDAEFLNHILETRFVPELDGKFTVPRESCPEIDYQLDQLVHEHACGDIVVIGRRRAVSEWRNRSRKPELKMGEICNRYDAIPHDYFKFNDWSFEFVDPFDVIAKGSDPFSAEWFYPAVALSDVQRLQAKGPDNTSSNGNRGAPKRSIPKSILLKELEAIKEKGGPLPAADPLVVEIQKKHPEYHVTRGDVRTVHREVFGELRPGRRRKNG